MLTSSAAAQLAHKHTFYSDHCPLQATTPQWSDDRPDSQQWKWLEANLAALPIELDFVTISLHHPLYSRSTENGRSQRLGLD